MPIMQADTSQEIEHSSIHVVCGIVSGRYQYTQAQLFPHGIEVKSVRVTNTRGRECAVLCKRYST